MVNVLITTVFIDVTMSSRQVAMTTTVVPCESMEAAEAAVAAVHNEQRDQSQGWDQSMRQKAIILA